MGISVHLEHVFAIRLSHLPILMMRKLFLLALLSALFLSCESDTIPFNVDDHDRIAIVGNTFAEGFQRHNYFETLLYHSFPDKNLVVRNLGWSADEVDLMPRPLNFPSLDQQLTELEADVIFLSYGLNESYRGEAGLEDFRQDLETFILHLKSMQFNGEGPPRLILLSPGSYEQLSPELPGEQSINYNLKMYTDAMRQISRDQEVAFIDLHHPVRDWMDQENAPLTTNGIHLNDQSRIRVAEFLASKLRFPVVKWENDPTMNSLREIVREKNRHFFYTYRPSNNEYIIGRRKDWPGGQVLHHEISQTRKIVSKLDSLIWDYAKSPTESVFRKLPAIIQYGEGRPETLADRTSFPPDKNQFILKEGYEIALFASEQEFPIGNPVTMTFDAKGRLWLSTMPSYPNYYPGDPPNDQIVILEDIDQDGRADQYKIFADSLYLPLGFELDGQGVYVTEAPDLLYLQDTTGDDVADTREFVLHGFGTEDAHHSLSAYTWGPDGALYMHMGTFLHTQVETPYGPQRGAYGTTWRYDPQRKKLDNYISYPYANPWGNVFNQYGDHLIADASTGRCHFGTPLSTNIDYPKKHTSQAGFLTAAFTPKTCGMEIISSSNFPDEVQGDILLNTFVGFQGIRQHRLIPDSSQYLAEEVEPLLQSKDPNFRPVDLKFGPDGALYVLDWFNPIVQHGEQGFREEYRDHTHGRIWRITYNGNPIDSVKDYSKRTINELLLELESATDRNKYRIRRQLGTYPADVLLSAVNEWLGQMDEDNPQVSLHHLEALWLHQRMNRFNESLLKDILSAKNDQIRAAGVKVLFQWKKYCKNYRPLLLGLADDPSYKVRLETAVALSHEENDFGIKGLLKILQKPRDQHIEYVLREAFMNLQSVWMSMMVQDPDFLMDDLTSAFYLFNLLEDPELLSLPGFISDDSDWEKYTWQKPSDEQYSKLLGSNAFQRYQSRPAADGSIHSAVADDSSTGIQITLKAVPGKMIYDQDTLWVRAGEKVVIHFENDDNMAHNIVVVAPGHKEEVGEMADQMAMESDGYERSFIPESENVLFYTPLVNSGESYILEFTAPVEKGHYPFICTFPGHWRIMQGVLVVD